MSETIDNDIYNIYSSISSGDESVLAALRSVPDLDTEKAKFISEGFESNPKLTPVIDTGKLQASIWGFQALKSYIEEEDNIPGVVKDAYLPLIEEDIHTNRMLVAATLGDVEKFVQAN